MANASSVWGIEIGQSALKALRCSVDGDQVVAEAFDYIEYPKILSSPDSNAEEMVREALSTFVNRNDLKKTRVALSVPGSSGLAKFFKPPPVELKKLPDIVKYEARQQIPFELEDVIWDYQLMEGSDISDGFALESEVGLFAMKRDAVYRTLQPLEDADVEIEILQLAPLSIYNMVTFERDLATDEDYQYDNEKPPRSTVVLAMGTDTTDLIVTNGYRVWQRSMPIGGNHFTRQLTKDLKLTFAKAEHLKRNAMEADDPKLVFQAMRPVFNDLVTEVQRSMGFFRSLNKNADIGGILMMGNSVQLPGLSQYLSKNLAMEVDVLTNFNKLEGGEVTAAPAFKDHVSTFAPVYGLCLQALGHGPVSTNLVPSEVVTERLVRSKKPWALAGAACLFLGFTVALYSQAKNYGEVHEDLWENATKAAAGTKSTSDTLISEDKAQMAKVALLKQLGEEVGGSGDRRILWMELLRSLHNSLKRPADFNIDKLPNPAEKPYKDWPELFLTKFDNKQVDDLTKALTPMKLKSYSDGKMTWRVDTGVVDAEAAANEAAEGDAGVGAEAGTEVEAGAEVTAEMVLGAPPEGADPLEFNKGWVIQIDGYHYHNDPSYSATGDQQERYVLKTLIRELEEGSVELPIDAEGKETRTFTYKELGLIAPLVLKGTYNPDHKMPNPEYQKKLREMGMASNDAGMGAGMGGEGGEGGAPGAGGMGGMGAGMGMGGPGGGMGGEGYGAGSGTGAGGYAAGDQKILDDDGNEIPKTFDAPRYDFTVQILWRETPLTRRLEIQRKAEEAAKAAAAAEAAMNGDDNLASS